jgi:Rrf2 family protein
MKFSAQEEYGLRCLVRLAHAGEGASLTIGELSELEGISAPNVAKIMRLLRRGGFVTSTRGQAGGYSLARPPSLLVVGDVVGVLGGRLYDARFCDRHSGLGKACARLTDCSLRPVWQQVQEVVDDVLGRLTIASLLRREEDSSTRRPARGIPLPVRMRTA